MQHISWSSIAIPKACACIRHVEGQNDHHVDAVGEYSFRPISEPGNYEVLELESPGWKSARSFRILSLHTGYVSFTDARYVVQRDTRRTSCGHKDVSKRIEVITETPNGLATTYLVHVLEPPDARYFPIYGANKSAQVFDRVRALLIWTRGFQSLESMQSGAEEICCKIRDSDLNLMAVVKEECRARSQLPDKLPYKDVRLLWSNAELSCREKESKRQGGHMMIWSRSIDMKVSSLLGKSTANQNMLEIVGHVPSDLLQLLHECRAVGAIPQVQIKAVHVSGDISLSEIRQIHVHVDSQTKRLESESSIIEQVVALAEWQVVAPVVYYVLWGVNLMLLAWGSACLPSSVVGTILTGVSTLFYLQRRPFQCLPIQTALEYALYWLTHVCIRMHMFLTSHAFGHRGRSPSWVIVFNYMADFICL
jgi:hypothetical protein